MGIEVVDNETEGGEIEGGESENEGVENEVLPLKRKGYLLQNLPTINYNDGRVNWWSMDWNNLIVGYHALHSVAKAYVNVVNSIFTFVEPTPPTNIITNDTIHNQYSIKHGLSVFIKKARLQYKNSYSSFMIADFFIQRSLKTSDMDN